jgi:hypothetical protein
LADIAPEQDGYPSDRRPAPSTAVQDATGQTASRTVQRARRKKQPAATQVDSAEQPALGALNRHLSVVLQQLTAAHQVIGRVVAERDALRQQLAELQGISVEEVEIPKIGAANETPPRQ